MIFSVQFKKPDFTQGPYPEAHTIDGKKVPPDGAAQPKAGIDGMLRASSGPMPIGLSYPEGQEFGPYRQMCGEGIFPSFQLNLNSNIPFSCGNVHPHTALMLFTLALNQRPKAIIETGTFYGYSTWFLAAALGVWRDEGSKVYTIDTDGKFIHASVRNHSHIECITGDSRIILPDLLEKIGEVQFVFLDSYKRIALSEFALIQNYMPPGGIVVFHDTQLLNVGKTLYRWFQGQKSYRDSFEMIFFCGTPHGDNPHRYFGNADDRGLLVVRRKEKNPFLDVADYGTHRQGMGDKLI